MLQPGAPSRPSGRSRFSKALPSVPVLDNADMPPMPASATTAASPFSPAPASTPPVSATPSAPQSSLRDLPPPPPPLHDDDPRVPVQFTPLPPVPTPTRSATDSPAPPPKTPTSTVTSPLSQTKSSAPPKMMIRRRPVGTKTQPPQPTPKDEPKELPAAVQPQPQPQPQPQQQQQQPLSSPEPVVAPPKDTEKTTAKSTVRDAVQNFEKNAEKSAERSPVRSVEKKEPERRTFETDAYKDSEKAPAVTEPKPPKELAEQAREPWPSAPPPTEGYLPKSRSKPPQLRPLSFLDPQYQQALQEPVKSPSDSLSSLLSAYSRSSTASIVRSSDGTSYSAADSHANESPAARQSLEREPPVDPAPGHFKTRADKGSKASLSTVTGIPANTTQDQVTSSSKPFANAHSPASPTPPPPPSKDFGVSTPPSAPTASPSADANSQTTPTQQPRPQIWRRRSANGSRELPNLRLDYSHGSTASVSSISTVTAAQRPQPPSKDSSPPQHTHTSSQASVGSKATPEPPAKESSVMGHGASRLRQLKTKFHLSRGSTDTTKSARDERPASGTSRPLTPEYQKEEAGRTPDLRSAPSVASPASSPERGTPTTRSSNATSLGGPTVAAPEPQRPSTSRGILDGLPKLDTRFPPPGMDDSMRPSSAQSGRGSPMLEWTPQRGSQGPRPPGYPGSGRNSPAMMDFPSRGRQQGPPGAFPPSSRNSSARPSSRGSMRPGGGGPRRPGPESEPRWVRSSSGELLYKGRDGTLYPEMKELQDPDPQALHFPTSTSELPGPDAVFKPVPISKSHLDCYQRHTTMLRRPNRRYPLACQTCDRSDAEDRFSCSFCHLRICEPCLKTFEDKKRDLKALMDELDGQSKTMSLSSPTRRMSALGLDIKF